MSWVLVAVGSVGFAVIAGSWLLSRIAESGGTVEGDAAVAAGQVIAQIEAFGGGSTREPWDGSLRLVGLERAEPGL